MNPLFRTVAICMLVCVSALLPVEPTSAQLKDDEKGYIKSEMLKQQEFLELQGMRDGRKSIKETSTTATEKNRDMLERAAKHYVYRLTESRYQEASDPTNPITMNQLVEQAFRLFVPGDPKRHVPNPPTAAQAEIVRNQTDYMREFTKALLVHLKKVLKNNETIARIGAARIVARLAECGQAEAADALVEMLEDGEQKEAIKFYALQGLKGYYDIAAIDSKVVIEHPQELKIGKALIKFIERPCSLAETAPKAQLDAFGYLRREAVRALAAIKKAVVNDLTGKLAFYPAVVLAKVLRKEGLTPEPSISERLDAALGLAQMPRTGAQNYQPDVTAYHLGWFLADFIRERNQIPDPQNKAYKPEPWKFDALRLSVALDKFKAEGNGAEGVDKINGVVDVTKDMLKEVEAGKVAATNSSNLLAWLAANKPKSLELFKGVGQSELKTTVSGN